MISGGIVFQKVIVYNKIAFKHFKLIYFNMAKSKLDIIIKTFYQCKSVLLFSFLIFTILIKYQPPNGKLSSGEEMYFGFALALDKEIPNSYSSFGLTELKSRYFFNKLSVVLIKKFGHEKAQRIGRLISLILYSMCLGYFFKLIRFNLFQLTICLLMFLFFGQDLFGGEWFFHSLQPKIFAYPILFLALTCIIKNRFLESTIWLAITTHIHFLIGGWFFLFSLIFMTVKKVSGKKFFNYIVIYTVVATPLIVHVLKNHFIIADLENFKNFPSADWIYAFYRHPHHIAPFKNFSFFYGWWFKGIIISIPLTILSFHIYSKGKSCIYQNIALLNIIIFAQLYFCLILAFFDQTYFFGKFMMFRSTSMALFLSIVLSIIWINQIIDNQKSKTNFNLFIFSILFLIHFSNYPWKLIQMVRQPIVIGTDLIDFIVDNTFQDDIILIDPRLENKLLHFERQTQRPTLVTRTFIPTTKTGILEWYRRIQFKEKIFNNLPTNEEYQYSYLITSVSKSSLNEKYGNPIYKKNYFVYRRPN